MVQFGLDWMLSIFFLSSPLYFLILISFYPPGMILLMEIPVQWNGPVCFNLVTAGEFKNRLEAKLGVADNRTPNEKPFKCYK